MERILIELRWGLAAFWSHRHFHQGRKPLLSEPIKQNRMSRHAAEVFARHNYELLGELGRGGMGIVYLAQHKKLGRRVAIKTLTPDRMAKENSMARFEREAKVFAAIRHPHIANLYEFEDEGPVAFLALEYIEGTDLEKERRKGRKWSAEEVGRIVFSMADALAHTHEKGILHRDIKPGNILIERNTERPVLTDFGLAKGRSDDTLTAAGFAVGTPAYMAPEQITDQFGGKPDGRADLFSLGTVAYEMITGQHPFLASDDLNTMRNIVNGKLKPIRELNPDAPEELCRILETMLEKNPRDRVPDAATLASQLRAWLGDPETGSGSSSRRNLAPVSAPTPKAAPAPAPAPAAAAPPQNAIPPQAAVKPGKVGGLTTGQVILIAIIVGALTLLVGIILGVFVFGG